MFIVTCNVGQVSGASAGDSGTWRWELESYVLGTARGEAGTGEVAVEVEEEEVNTTTATTTTTTTTQPSAATAISNHTSATATTHPKILDIIRTLTEATTIAVTATTTTGTTTTAAVQTSSPILAREGKSLKNIRMNIKREDEVEKLSSSLFMWNPHRIPIVILTAAVASLLLLLPCLACFVFCRPDRRMSYSVEDQEEAEDKHTTRIEKDWNIFVPHTLKWLHDA